MLYKKPMRSYEAGGLVDIPDVVGRANESVDRAARSMEEHDKLLKDLKKKLMGDNPGTKKREERSKTHSNKPKKPKKKKTPQTFPGKIFRWPI